MIGYPRAGSCQMSSVVGASPRTLSWEVLHAADPATRAGELARECADAHGVLSALSGGLPYPIAGRVNAAIASSSAIERVKMLFDVLEGTSGVGRFLPRGFRRVFGCGGCGEGRGSPPPSETSDRRPGTQNPANLRGLRRPLASRSGYDEDRARQQERRRRDSPRAELVPPVPRAERVRQRSVRRSRSARDACGPPSAIPRCRFDRLYRPALRRRRRAKAKTLSATRAREPQPSPGSCAVRQPQPPASPPPELDEELLVEPAPPSPPLDEELLVEPPLPEDDEELLVELAPPPAPEDDEEDELDEDELEVLPPPSPPAPEEDDELLVEDTHTPASQLPPEQGVPSGLARLEH
jgi:hypothetical protein